MAGQDFDRARNLQTIMNHAFLSGGECWHNRLAEVRAPALITLKGAGDELHPVDWEIIIDPIIRHTVG